MISETEHNGRRIRRFKAGDKSTALSARRMNEVVDSLNALNNIRLVNGDSNRVFYGEGGVLLQVEGGSGGNAPPAPPSGDTIAMQYRLKSVHADYLTCRTWDGTTEGGSDVLIAKPCLLRNSVVSRTLFGGTANEINATFTYSTGGTSPPSLDSMNVYRFYTDDRAISEDQIVIPVWVLNDIIYAIAVDHSHVTVGGVELPLVMVSESRQWARVDPP